MLENYEQLTSRIRRLFKLSKNTTFGYISQVYSAGAVNWFSDIREKETCKIISDLAGTKVFEDVSINNRSQSSQDPNDQAFSISNRSAPMFRDLRTELQNNEALIVYKNLPVIKAKKVPYYSERRFADVAGKDPFES